MSHSPTRASRTRRPVAFVPQVQESVVVDYIDMLCWLGVALTRASALVRALASVSLPILNDEVFFVVSCVGGWWF